MSPRKITQIAPSAARDRLPSTTGPAFCRKRRKPKPALINGISVSTAPVETELVNRKAINIVMKYTPISPPSTR